MLCWGWGLEEGGGDRGAVGRLYIAYSSCSRHA